MILEPVTCSWFLCLFVNSLPLPGLPLLFSSVSHSVSLCLCLSLSLYLSPEVLRIWDCVLWEGNIVLFRVGLAICKLLVCLLPSSLLP
jgi:hypothetical protein